ncbi:MAG: NMD3-related protein [Candidatus Woesearchaeota archaeon]
MAVYDKRRKKHSQYFEGILQLREPTEEVLDFIDKEFARNPDVWIAKEVRMPKGIDLYVSSQRFLRALGKKLNDHFFGILKFSRKIHTKHQLTSKSLYRVYVYFRPLKLKRGQTLTIEGEQFEVLSFERQVSLKNIRTGRKERMKVEEIERYIR